MTRVAVTGSDGFLGKETALFLERHDGYTVHRIPRRTSEAVLTQILEASDVVIHLAGVNRTAREQDFIQTNINFTQHIIDKLLAIGRPIPILFSSSIQAELSTAYGHSKRAAEEVLEAYANKNKAPVACFRLPNIFGAGGRPNYNSVVTTFCHNIARNHPIVVDDPVREINLIYIGDVVRLFSRAITNIHESSSGFFFAPIEPVYKKTLGQLAELINYFHQSRKICVIPNLHDRFTFLLHSVFTSSLPPDGLSINPKIHKDNRGSLFELIKSNSMGQVFVSTTKPGVTRGNHFHFRKIEKYCVIQGKALISLRELSSDRKVDYQVSGDNVEIIDIPTGFTHSIKNTGEEDLVTLFWANEIFSQESPDTYVEEV